MRNTQVQCERGDSNPHAVKHRNLNPAATDETAAILISRTPIPPAGSMSCGWKPIPTAMIVLMLCSGCLGTSLAATACDWHQTRTHTLGSGFIAERNPILGDAPATHDIDLYFMAAAAALVAAGYITPEQYRAYLHTAVTSIELHASWIHMRTVTPGFCGWR